MSMNFFTKELIEAIRRPRGLILKLIFPSIFALPLLFSGTPVSVAAGIITMITLMIGVFGVSVGLTKDRSDGVLERAFTTPVSSKSILIGQVGAGVLVELIQLIPILALVIVRGEGSFTWEGTFVAVAVLTVLSVNLLGLLVSGLASSSGEVHLFSTLVVFPLIGISGIFRTPAAADSVMAKASLLSPLTYLYQGLMAVLGQAPRLDASSLLSGSAMSVAVLLLLTYLQADRIVRRELS